MPSQSFRIGVSTLSLSLDSSTALPSLASLTFTASAITPTTLLRNDIKNELSTTPTYQVILGLVGRDDTNQGYTVGNCSPGSGILSLTSGQVIEVKVPNANWPSNYNLAAAVAVFLKIGTANFQLAGFAYLDDQNDFSYVIKAKPVINAPKFATSLLQSTTSDTTLGDRAPKGYTFSELSPTTGGVTVTRETNQVNIDPDTGVAFNVAAGRTASISFQLLSNDIIDVVRGNAGDYVEYTSGGATFKMADMSMTTAVVKTVGNRPLKMTLPPDNAGVQEVRLYLGQLTQNQEGNTEAWTKSAPTPITYTYSPVTLDKLLLSQQTEISYRRS